MRRIIPFLFFMLITASISAQKVEVYPPNWWVGMKNNHVQLMVHGDDIGKINNLITFNPGISIDKIHHAENKNYLFLDITISAHTHPGKITFHRAGKSIHKRNTAESHPFFSLELKNRRKGKNVSYAQGITSKDFIYLILPDRFSNGDTSNDRIIGMRDQSLNRDTVFNRHGGDLKGIQNHLDYIKDLGATTLWLNPVWENDMPERTEHGYAFTNQYKVDPRLGGNNAYHELVDDAHAQGLKIIQDAVYNHVGSYHFTVLDPPMKDWLHQWPTYTNTIYKDQTLFDPYAADSEKKKMEEGWFTPMMPDLNQQNPFVANFLIQHALWTVEEFGIDGWRIDTYPYNDLTFMNRCNKALYDEYPNITLFGETWVHGVPNQSYFCQNKYDIPFKSNLQATTDFQCLWGITAAMNEDFEWDNGVNKLYTTLAQDFVYQDPSRQVVFLDNHDLSRYYSVVNENIDKYLSSICWLMTTRGIPQLYYASELATTGTTSPNDGYVRLDFPGGWKNDSLNKFNSNERNVNDNKIFNTWKTLADFRKHSSAITQGQLTQFLPEDGVYCYFRYNEKQTVMVVINTAKEEKNISFNRYSERIAGFSKYIDVLTGKEKPIGDFKLGAYQTVVLELK